MTGTSSPPEGHINTEPARPIRSKQPHPAIRRYHFKLQAVEASRPELFHKCGCPVVPLCCAALGTAHSGARDATRCTSKRPAFNAKHAIPVTPAPSGQNTHPRHAARTHSARGRMGWSPRMPLNTEPNSGAGSTQAGAQDTAMEASTSCVGNEGKQESTSGKQIVPKQILTDNRVHDNLLQMPATQSIWPPTCIFLNRWASARFRGLAASRSCC